MKKKLELQVKDDGKDLQIIKAVAQAWHSHTATSTGNNSTTNEFDSYRRNFKGKPSRFKLEAILSSNKTKFNRYTSTVRDNIYSTAPIWDFRQSLWDSYEIVTVSKKLEAGLVLDEHDLLTHKSSSIITAHRKRRESKNSLRNLFKRVSNSRRFNEADIPRDAENHI